ncbi:hypothetical protein VNO80_14503 [Phaseolus coccineus]|uniref:Uncharacterized protein n=1 Tax=Phaseolus coccineus TaxID=3886 RepID=A0AAN9MNI0_PHACN
MGYSSIIILCTLLLLFFSPSTYASASDEAALQAKKLISGLNLFPDDVNVVPVANSSLQPHKIVEKRLRFPNLVASDSEPSVEDLGHYAGYYPIVHSHAARKLSCAAQHPQRWFQYHALAKRTC